MDLSHFFGATPARPDVPDFWTLSEIILSMDAPMQEAKTPEATQAAWDKAMANAAIDSEALGYMAIQRAMRMTGVTTRGELVAKQDIVMMLASMYLEAVLVGIAFEKRRQS